LVKFVLLLVLYRVHDYALEIVQRGETASLLSADLAADLRNLVRASVPNLYLIKAIFGIVFAMLVFIVGWPRSESRKMARFYLKRRAGYFFYYMWRLTARGGERNASVSDGQP
jgi:hypothetical protein